MFTATGEEKRIMMSSHLSKELRAAYGFRSFPIHSEDVVVVKIGKFKNHEGKVEAVNRATGKVSIEGCTMVKSTGGTAFYPIDPSNLVIKQFFLDDNRTAALDKKKAIVSKKKAAAN